MPVDPFVHLHAHSEFSRLDGHARHKPMFARAAELGQAAIAMTDHGNTFGAYSFWHASKDTGVKPVIGCEAYMAPSSRYSRKPEFWGHRGGKGDNADGEGGKDVSGAGKYTHMTLWAQNAPGLRNLFALTSRAYQEGYYAQPRADLELLAEYSGGLMGSTGCPSGAVQTRLRLGQYDQAVEAAGQLRDILGKDNVFVELMDHGIDIERAVRDDLLRLGKQLGLPFIATNDSHYVYEHEADAHDDLLCVGVGKDKHDPTRFKFNGSGYYIKSGAEMAKLFDGVPGACSNTLLIAERVESYDEVFAYRDRSPRFKVPDGQTQETWLRHQLELALTAMFPAGVPAAYRERLESELTVIMPQGFAAYFLVLADIVAWCATQGIPTGPGRGSAAGSLVAWLMGITRLDPIKFRLLFERFLNPERVSPPDIDLDVSQERRGEVVQYIIDTYGADHAVMVNTRGTVKAKAAIKDSARILGMPYNLGDELTKLLPGSIAGKDVPLACVLDEKHVRYGDAEPLRERYNSDEQAKQVLDTAFGIEGRIRNWGKHAAAVLISSEPVLGQVPLRLEMVKGKEPVTLAGFDYELLEKMGFLKLDLLGLRNLDLINRAVKHVARTRGVTIDLYELPLDDPDTFELVGAGRTLGVFQLDGAQMRQLLRQLHPRTFDDISAVLALYRPGPMGMGSHTAFARRANGREEVEPVHPHLADALGPILEETHGVIVYQEQVLAIAQTVAGYSLGQADLLRKAMGKKKQEVLDVEKPRFLAGMDSRGFSQESGEKLWATLMPFADYAFNRSHTAAYGLIAYWTAYLKAHYPAEYMAALLTSVGDDRDKMSLYLAECRDMGIRVLQPDVNESDHGFTPASATDIRFGLTAIKGVGEKVVDGIIAGRADSPYRSFPDFLTRVGGKGAAKATVAALIQAGAFDSFGQTRKGLYDAHSGLCEAASGLRKKRTSGQGDLFGDAMDAGGIELTTSAEEWPRRDLLSREWTMLGRYVSGHPADTIADALRAHRNTTIANLAAGDLPDGARVELAGVITSVERRRAKKSGRMYAKVTLEDLDAAIEVMVFGDTFDLTQHRLVRDEVVAIRGRAKVTKEEPVEDPETGVVNEGSTEVSVWVDDVASIDIERAERKQRRRDALSGRPELVTVRLPLARVSEDEMTRLSTILTRHRGTVPVQLHLAGAKTHGYTRYELPRYPVDPCPQLMSELRAAFGPEAVA